MARRTVETRGDVYGVKPGVIARRSEQLIAKAEAALAALSCLWFDVDAGPEVEADHRVRDLASLRETVKECTERLREPWDAQG